MKKPTRALWPEHPLELKLADFTTAPPPGKGEGYNLIICNPPYVRHHHLDRAAKRRLLTTTGDNAFFIMTRDQIAAHNLPRQFLKPILPGPRYLEANIIEAESDGTPKRARQLFMLDCRLPENEVQELYPALWTYLQTGRATVAKTYLCSRRTPWYVQENRPPAPFVCTYMGRNLAKRDEPFRFIWNRSKATVANVYLLLYPKQAFAKVLAGSPALERKVWEFLSGIDATTLLGEGRVYGGGLYKMEPKELANVPAAAIAELVPASLIRSASQVELCSDKYRPWAG